MESLDNGGSSSFQYKLDETKNKVHELLEKGALTQKDYDQLINMERDS